ncbi:hypothetical protein MUK42_17024 [Musa troglodytarum]|uniref:Uncharacterized protein n=1 Tax=Musa troglodytarum TaxID=320322 RepID=A0A9E7KZP5_9LILI|nr:hypothetical protein MUK42_17024 [Musa troglodytarum]
MTSSVLRSERRLTGLISGGLCFIWEALTRRHVLASATLSGSATAIEEAAGGGCAKEVSMFSKMSLGPYAVKRKAVGIWGCKDCGKVKAGGAYTLNGGNCVPSS